MSGDIRATMTNDILILSGRLVGMEKKNGVLQILKKIFFVPGAVIEGLGLRSGWRWGEGHSFDYI